MIKAIIIDDEPLARSIIVNYLQNNSEIKIVQECNDGFEGAKAIMHHKPELIFLDIQMPKITGFEMLEILDYQPSVIFTTAYDEFAMKAFDINAVDYLLKPFDKDRFDKAIHKWQLQYRNQKTNDTQEILLNTFKQREEQHRIVVKINNNIKIIPIDEIFYIEAFDDYVKIHLKDSFVLKKKTMNYYEEVLSKTIFSRVHRSFIINIQQLTKIELIEKDKHIAILKNGAKVTLSKSGYIDLKNMLGI